MFISIGPFGRSAEAAGTAGQMAPIFSYSKTKGLFAGISIEGSVIVERKDANRQFYGKSYSPSEILSGSVPPPPAADPLYRALDRQSHISVSGAPLRPGYQQMNESATSPGSSHAPPPANYVPPQQSYGPPSHLPSQQSYAPPPHPPSHQTYAPPPHPPVSFGGSSSSSSFTTPTNAPGPSRPFNSLDRPPSYQPPAYSSTSLPRDTKPKPPAVPPRLVKAVALYEFVGERPGDLSFKEGDVITITRKTNSTDDWWTGSLQGVSGEVIIFLLTV